MSLIDRQLDEVWDALRANGRERDDALAEVRIRKLRGIWDLRVPFEYPVSVLAGPNACGKSTVLLACACAYFVPDSGTRDFVPGSLFPDFTDRQHGTWSDTTKRSEIEFHYLYRGDRLSMIWRRTRHWKRNFVGRTGSDVQPQRDVYLRTLANLTNPAEVRGILQLGRKPTRSDVVSPELLVFATASCHGVTASWPSSASGRRGNCCSPSWTTLSIPGIPSFTCRRENAAFCGSRRTYPISTTPWC